jgi:hypothetical protein
VIAALAIAVVAAATLAGAWFFELVLDIRPCPLCLEQRYAYYLAVPLALVVAFAASRGAPRQVTLAGFALLLLAALGNAWLGGYHAGVEWQSGRVRPGARVGGQSRQRRRPVGRSTPWVIRCDEVQASRLSLAGYNVLISLLMARSRLGIVRRSAAGSVSPTTRRANQFVFRNAESSAGNSVFDVYSRRPGQQKRLERDHRSHSRQRLRENHPTSVFHNVRHGVWAPAFAGTTR